MVSVWPQIDWKSENYEEMKQKGLLVKAEKGVDIAMLYNGNSTFYDATNPRSRAYVSVSYTHLRFLCQAGGRGNCAYILQFRGKTVGSAGCGNCGKGRYQMCIRDRDNPGLPEQVFHGALPVVAPADEGGNGEGHQSQGQERRAAEGEVGKGGGGEACLLYTS